MLSIQPLARFARASVSTSKRNPWQMQFDRWDIVEAHYWFAVHYHGGQFSDLYAKQSRISEYFKPSILSDGPSSENACEIYNNLERKYGYNPTPYVVLESGEAKLSA